METGVHTARSKDIRDFLQRDSQSQSQSALCEGAGQVEWYVDKDSRVRGRRRIVLAEWCEGQYIRRRGRPFLFPAAGWKLRRKPCNFQSLWRRLRPGDILDAHACAKSTEWLEEHTILDICSHRKLGKILNSIHASPQLIIAPGTLGNLMLQQILGKYWTGTHQGDSPIY